MAETLAPEQHATYGALIDGILAKSDLNTISAKRIRKDLQDKVDFDLTPLKKPITELIMERFDKAQAKEQENGAVGTVEPVPTANGTAHDDVSPPASAHKRKERDDEDEDMSEVDDSSPAPKKVKKSNGAVESDEKLAARLQAELNAQTRSTRGGGTTKRKPAAKKQTKTKKKSKAKVGSDDDSEVEGEEKPEKEKKGGFHKPMNLSEPLSAMLGESQLSRPQTVKKIWEYVKARDLQDPSDKRNIRCDDAMRAVFKADKVHMFTMNKLLATHLYPADEV
ncbi:hypothetical protein PRZ48_008388 [Zasmidium cellare]|uniref:DM2 domain-containing protein n=1 Tax=Zasmidium cellare TaxID=395010 RepID=A0ABR0EFD9_ZASCE|nr:hypothetical protein PRZ48_008388 [Zasmidium cellare]